MTPHPSSSCLRWPTALASSLALALALALSACGGDDPVKLMAEAKTAIGKNDLTTAVIQLKRVLQQDPAAAEARFLLGKSLQMMGDKVGAESELQKASDAGYAADEVAPLLAQALVDLGQHKRLEEKFAGMRLQNRDAQAAVLVALAKARRDQGQTDRALAALDEALRVQPDHVPARLAKARALAINKQFEQGWALTEQVLAQHPNHAGAIKLQGDFVDAWKHEPAQALALYERAAKADPKLAEAQAAIVGLHLRMQQVDRAQQALTQLMQLGDTQPMTLYLAAQLAVVQGKLPEARGFSQKLLRLAPDHGGALELAGIIEYNANLLGQAEPLLARAVKADPSLITARQLLIQSHLRSGQFDKAAAALPDKLDDVQDPDIVALAGQVFQLQGDAARAQALFAKAAQLAPNDPRKQTSLALSKLASGKDVEALGDLRGIAGRDKGVVADMALINALLQRGDFDRAMEATAALEAKQPGDPMAKLIRAQALAGKGDEQGARQVLEAASKAAPSYFPAVRALVLVDTRAGKLAEGQQRVEAFLAREPKHVGALLTLAQLRQSQGAKPEEVRALLNRAVEAAPEEPQARLTLIRYQLSIKDAKGALTSAQGAVAALPNNPAVYDALGQAQLAAGEHNQALNTYGKLLTTQPGSIGPYLRMADVHVAAQNFNQAGAVLRKALDIKPDALEVQLALANLALRTNAVADALAVARKVQKQRPKEPIGHMMEGDVLLATKKYDEAAAAYQAARARAPNATEVALKLYAVHLRAGKRAEAERFAETWQAGHPQDMAFKQALSGQALSDNNLPLAEKYLRQVHAASPNNIEALNNLSWVLYKRGSKEALTHAERALALAPYNAEVLDTAATVLASAGQVARAQETMRKAIALQPGRHDFLVNLARLQIQAGDKSGAKATLTAVQKQGSAYAGQAEVTGLLRGL